MYRVVTTQHDRTVIVKDESLWIPADPDNTDYQQYLAWLAEGNEPEEWAPEEVSE